MMMEAMFMMFQSLLGFLMRCDSGQLGFLRSHLGVSIPAGFSDALRRDRALVEMFTFLFQSLLGFLMRCDLLEHFGTVEKVMFQSLLGFLMRCDTGIRSVIKPCSCFNPCWVF